MSWLGRRVKLIGVHDGHTRYNTEGVIVEIRSNRLWKIKFDKDSKVLGFFKHRLKLIDEPKKIEPLPLPE